MISLTSKSGKVIDLRPPQLGDEPLIFNYDQELQAEDTYVLLNPVQPVTLAEVTNYLHDSLTKINALWQVHYLAFYQGKLIGSSQVTKQGRRKMHVGAFGISLLKDFRADGLGEQLAKMVLADAKAVLNLSLITLEVFSGNTAALKLYQKQGFIEYGRIPQGLQYRDGFNDAIYMFKTI